MSGCSKDTHIQTEITPPPAALFEVPAPKIKPSQNPPSELDLALAVRELDKALQTALINLDELKRYFKTIVTQTQKTKR